MKQARDFQRSKVYSATHALPDGQRLKTLTEVQGYIDEIIAFPWVQEIFRQHHNGYKLTEITLKDGRGRRKACAGWNWRDRYYIALPRWSRYETMILHELAHTLASRKKSEPWHGKEFVGIFLILAKRIMGVDGTEIFQQYKVKW